MHSASYKRKLVAVAAPSGGGKTTLCRMLCARYSALQLSVSFTTRKPRGTEKNGVDYFFVSQERFQELIATDALAEYAEVHGNCYGTSKSFVAEQVALGKVVILDIDVQGVDSLKRVYGNQCLSVFLAPPNLEELEKRLRLRNTESEEKIQQRLMHAKVEIAAKDRFEICLVNDQLEDTFESLCKILEREVGLGA